MRLGKVAGRLVHPHRLAGTLVGAQVLAQAFLVVGNELVGRIEDVAEAAVVLLQLDLVLHIELPHEIGHVADPCTTKSIDALVVVAHGQHRAGRMVGGCLALPRDQLDPGVLQLVGVLELVDQDVAKAPLVMLADRIVVAQQLIGAQHQLPEIHHAFALALVFVELVDLDLLARFLVARLDPMGAQAFFLVARYEVLDLLGREKLVVDVELLHQPLDGRELVLRVQNLERLRQVGQLVVRTQEAVTQAMEGADPHAPHVQWKHGRQPRHHLFRGLVGEGHGQNAARRNLPGLQQPGNARGQHPCLARAGTCQNQGVLRGQSDGAALFRVEIV